MDGAVGASVNEIYFPFDHVGDGPLPLLHSLRWRSSFLCLCVTGVHGELNPITVSPNILIIFIYQSAPKIIVQLVVTGAQILGKAFYEAGKQAVKSMSLPTTHVYKLTNET